MVEFEDIAPNYHRAQQRWPDASSLCEHYSALATCYSGNGYGLVEYVKSFVEAVCRTILGELGAPMPCADYSTTQLFRDTLAQMGCQNSRGLSPMDKVLSGLNKMADGITEMRNETGAVAHGKDGFLDAIAANHARAFLHAGDAMLGILLDRYDGMYPDLKNTREPYGMFPLLHRRVDRAVALKARIDEDEEHSFVIFSITADSRAAPIELRVEPSRLLYGIDREIYVEVLNTAELPVVEEEEEEEPEAASRAKETYEAARFRSGSQKEPVIEIVSTYTGPLDGMRLDMLAVLTSEGVDPSLIRPDKGEPLIDSVLATAEDNLALDWNKRENIQSGLKIGLKRVLVQFGCDPKTADRIAKRLVALLRERESDLKSDRTQTDIDEGAEA